MTMRIPKKVKENRTEREKTERGLLRFLGFFSGEKNGESGSKWKNGDGFMVMKEFFVFLVLAIGAELHRVRYRRMVVFSFFLLLFFPESWISVFGKRDIERNKGAEFERK